MKPTLYKVKLMNRRLGELFHVETGKDLILGALEDGEYPVVGHSAENHGVVAWSSRLPDHKLYPKETITLADRGNFYATVQPFPCYIGTRVKALVPKKPMLLREKQYYCQCINANQYRFNYGRNATDKTPAIELPDTIPSWVYEMETPSFEDLKDASTDSDKPLVLDTRGWRRFKYPELFDITGSKTTPVKELEQYGKGSHPYVTTQATNNGISGFYAFRTEKGNVLVVDSAVAGYCSYQGSDFSASDHVEKLLPRFALNVYVGLFLATVINVEQYRYSYGRKCSQRALRKSTVKLPVTPNGEPDWRYMERYIESLPYSRGLNDQSSVRKSIDRPPE